MNFLFDSVSQSFQESNTNLEYDSKHKKPLNTTTHSEQPQQVHQMYQPQVPRTNIPNSDYAPIVDQSRHFIFEKRNTISKKSSILSLSSAFNIPVDDFQPKASSVSPVIKSNGRQIWIFEIK